MLEIVAAPTLAKQESNCYIIWDLIFSKSVEVCALFSHTTATSTAVAFWPSWYPSNRYLAAMSTSPWTSYTATQHLSMHLTFTMATRAFCDLLVLATGAACCLVIIHVAPDVRAGFQSCVLWCLRGKSKILLEENAHDWKSGVDF